MPCARPDLLHRPRVAVGVAEAEERAAVPLVEDDDLVAVDATPDELGVGRPGVRDDELDAVQAAGGIARRFGIVPMTTEQPEPRGVSWAIRPNPASVSWSRWNPTRSR